jgi:hypothetical protein
VPRGLIDPVTPATLPVDLRGDGEPLLATLGPTGGVVLRDGLAPSAQPVWANEAPDWHVQAMAAGDPNDDGRIELALALWRPDAAGRPRSHPFLVGWRGGRFRVVWGGSAAAEPIQDLAVGDVDGDGRDELALLLGGESRGDPATGVSLRRWRSWIFVEDWRAPIAAGRRLWLHDLTNDGRPEVLVRTDAGR